MKNLHTQFTILTLAFTQACAPTQIPSADVNANPNTNPNLTPSTCATDQLPTTKQTCISLSQINQFNLTMQSTIVGFTRYTNQSANADAILLERSAGAFKVWDLYALPDSTSMIASLVPLCTLTKPGALTDHFAGLNYSNNAFHTLAIDVNTMTRVYDLSAVTCIATPAAALQLTYDSCPNQTNFLLGDSVSFIYSFNCKLYKQAGAAFNLINFTTTPIAGETANPNVTNVMAKSNAGEYWFVASNNNQLWHADVNLVTDGWVQLPTTNYNELYSVAGASTTQGSHLHLLTMTNQTTLKIFDFDVSHFSGGTP